MRDKSVNKFKYGSLLSGEYEDDVDNYHDEDEHFMHKSFYAVDDKLTDKLQNRRELNMDSLGIFKMKVRKQNV